MPSTFTFTHRVSGVATVSSAESLGIASLNITRESQQDDVAALEIRAAVDDPDIWSFGEEVTIRRDGAVIFVGYAQPSTISGGPDNESRTVELRGPWWKLGRLQFIIPAPGVPAPEYEQFSARRQLFTRDNGDPMTTREMMVEVLEYAKGKGVISGYTGTNDLEDSIYPAPEESVDRSIAEVMQTVLRFHLDVAVYFTGRVINLKRRGLSLQTYEVGTPPLSSVDVSLRTDLAPEGVWIRYEVRRALQLPSGYKSAFHTDAWPGHAKPGDEGVVFETIQLDAGDEVPSGLARRFYDMWRNPPIAEGTIVFRAEECTTLITPGTTLNITGYQHSAAAMKAFVQTVQEDHNAGITTCTVGLPAHLGLRDLLDLIRLHRRRVADNQIGDPPLATVEVPDTALTPYMDYVERVPVLRVTPGEVRDGINALTPTWDTSSTPLDATEAPYTALLLGADFDVYVYVEFTPEAVQFDVEDAAGDSFQEWLGVGTGTLDDVRIKFSPSGARAPEVDPSSGSTTSGRYFFKIGSVVWPSGDPLPTVTVTRRGSLQIMHVPPARMFIFTVND